MEGVSRTDTASIPAAPAEPAANSKKDKAKKPSIWRWKGVTARHSRIVRVMSLIVLLCACATLTFVQLGFAGIGVQGDYIAYVVTLLLPVALGALLLGILPGTLIGLFAGAVLYVHALVLPLNFYEYAYVTPLSSIFLLTFSGFLLGLFFAIALRKDPPTVRRIIYIAIVCIIVSFIYSTGFFANTVFLVISQAFEAFAAAGNALETATGFQLDAAGTALSMGNLDLQIWCDAFLMVALCVAADLIMRRANWLEENTSLRALFSARLAIVVLLVFMVVMPISFASITEDEKNDAYDTMSSEVTYLCNQLDGYESRMESLFGMFDKLGVSDQIFTEENIDMLVNAITFDGLLDGYTTAEDGVLFVAYDDGTIILSNDARIVSESEDIRQVSDVFGADTFQAIENCLATGKLQRIVYDPSRADWFGGTLETLSNVRATPDIAYLYAEQASFYRVVNIMTAKQVFASRGGVMGWTTVSFVVLLLVVFFVVARLLDAVVVRRISKTNETLELITGGDLDARIEAAGTEEFRSLSSGINETVVALKGWIAEAETRMDAELATAKTIQESALPQVFPPYPDIMRFDIYASMKPAREVGGDFYDFFLIGDGCGPHEGKLGFVIADVSGKGVPAALFMMNAKALIRSYMENGVELGEAIENANRQLCDGNEQGMFVTAFAGVLDYATGHIDFVNAGHNPPLLWQEGSWRWLKDKSGLPLGLYDSLPYKAHAIDCTIGDQLLLYTDGVTESMDVDEALYGEERLEQLARDNFAAHPRQLVDAVRRDVARHARGAVQSDDITILALEYGVPPEVTATLFVRADTGELPRVNEFIHTELDRRLCPLRTQKQLDIAVEELFVNVAHYAYPDATPEHPGMVRVSYTYRADPPSIVVDIADQGIPYDPLAKPDAVTPDNIMDVPIGGLGILMAKRSVDEMRYERTDDGSNVVTIIKKW